MIPDRPQERTGLVLIFDTSKREQAEALHTFRAAFGAATELEALDEKTYVLHVCPGVCGCGEAA